MNARCTLFALAVALDEDDADVLLPLLPQPARAVTTPVAAASIRKAVVRCRGLIAVGRFVVSNALSFVR
jgi:hypothetical protein